MPGRVFITGASGFVGKAILERLVADGREVVALARSESSARMLKDLRAEVVEGDVLQPEGVGEGMRGCEVVYHVAGVNVLCLPDPSSMFRINVEGSRGVIEAAAKAGVRRVVYTSSAATLGEVQATVGDERSRHRGSFLSNYERSKYEAERAVREAAERLGVDVVYVLPSSVQGPGRTGGTARLLLDFVNGKLKAVVATRLSLIYIADCTEGHVLAETRGRPGERYVLNGATLTVREALAMLGGITGVHDRPRFLPPFVAMAGATIVEQIASLRGKPPLVCREMVRTLLHGHAYDGSKAARELGLKYTRIEEVLRLAIAWYVRQGMITRPLPAFESA
jgi:dihydroflavonol-4-reductase